MVKVSVNKNATLHLDMIPISLKSSLFLLNTKKILYILVSFILLLMFTESLLENKGGQLQRPLCIHKNT